MDRRWRTAVLRIDLDEGNPHPIALSIDEGGDEWNAEFVVEDVFALPDEPPVALAGADGQDPGEVARRIVVERADDSPEFQEVGRWLYRALTANAAGAAWREAMAAGGLRTLLDIRAPRLAALPWELLSDPESPLGAFADAAAPLARVRAFKPALPKPEEWWPLLRVMVIVALDDDAATAELAGLHDGFAQVCGLVDLDVLRRPTEPCLRERYEELRPHVLHYIGHGRPGELLVPNPDGRSSWRWQAAAITALVRQWTPRLAVINACRSQVGAASLDQQDAVFGIADTLTGAGVSAVVAMQADVREDAAGAFSVELWNRLGGGAPVDEAVARARVHMAEVVGWSRRDPWLPALTVSVLPDDVLPRLYPLTKERRRVLQSTPTWETVHRFVDRGYQRRRVWRDIVDVAEDGPPDGILILGQSKVAKIGKTAFAKWCVGAAAMREYDSAYVDMDHRPRDPLALLAAIAEELAAGSGREARVTAPLDQYIGRVDELQGPSPPATAPLMEPGPYDRVLTSVALETLESMFDAFRGALAQIAGERRVLIALDHVPVPGDAYWGYFAKHVLGRLDDARAVCLIAVNDERDAELLLGRELARRFRDIELPLLPRVDLRELVGQALRANRFRRSDFNDMVSELPLPPDLPGVNGAYVDMVVGWAHTMYQPEDRDA